MGVLGALLLIGVLFGITIPILQGLKSRNPWLKVKLMKNLYWYHMLFAVVYYVFVQFSSSDSVAYYERTSTEYENWLGAYDTGTKFIDFLGYPFVNFLGFTYEMMMVLFAWFGYMGFVYFYMFFKENLNFKHKLFGFDLLNLLIFLPNMHFWTGSFGKGSTIFLGLGMAIFGLSRLNKRKIALIVGLLITYHVRPHVFLFMAVGILVGLFTGRQKVPMWQKFMVLAGSIVALALLFDKIMAFAHVDSDNLLESFDQFSSGRQAELAKAGSGIDISNYPLVLKLFTFWFRPLFFDAPNPVGIIVSFENLIYLILAGKLIQPGFIAFIRKGSALVKTSGVVFLATSLALSGTLSNLGIIIRQKSMVMYFFLFIILSFLDYKKGLQASKKKQKVQAEEQLPDTITLDPI